MDLDVLKVKFTHSNTVRDKKPYTIYEIEVRSSSTITWVIYKRYSSFFVLHQALASSIVNVPGGKNVKLPQIPPKRLTRSLAAEFVEKRKNELEEYLRSVLTNPLVLQCEVMLSFLEVPDSVRPMLSRRNQKSVGSDDMDGDSIDTDASKLNYGAKSPEERKIVDLVQVLKSHPNKVAALQNFEDYFFSLRPRLSSEVIRMLFEGLPGDPNVGGLIHTCGDFRYSRVASRAALCLIDRLLDAEKNKDAPSFVEQLVALPATVLQKMKLHVHILSARGNRVHAFKVIHVISQHIDSMRGSNTNPSLPNELSLESVVQDHTARQDYIRWVRCRDNQRIVSAATLNITVADKVAVRDGNHISLATNGFAEVLQLAEKEDGWKLVHPSTSTQYPVHISYCKDNERDTTTMRASVLLPFSTEDITAVLTDVSSLSSWDTKIHAAQVVMKLDDATDIVHAVYKSFASYYKCRDFSLLRSISRLDDGGILLVFRSVQSPRCPEIKEYTRSTMKPSGFVINPISTGEDGSEISSMVTYFLQLDKESVLLISQDLLGEADDIVRTMVNLHTSIQLYKET